LRERNVVLEGAVKDKTYVIKKLEEQLAASENNYLTLKAKISDYEFEMLKSQQEMKMAAHSVQSLKKQAEESKTSI
jgi:phage-related tail protein